MKRLVIVLLILTPWVMHSMEPKELKSKEVSAETLPKRYLEGRGKWVTLVKDLLQGDLPPSSATGISQVIAQKILPKGPPIRQFILSHVLFKDFVGHTDSVYVVKFNSTEDKIVTETQLGNAKIWDLESGKLIHTLPGESIAGDKILTFDDSDKVARLWDTKTGEFITLEGHTDGVLSAAFNPAGDKVATGSLFRDRTAKIWEAATGKLLHTLKGHTNGVVSVLFNPVGDQVATGSRDGTAKIWDVETGRLLHTLKSPGGIPLHVLGFNSAGDKVVTTTETGDTKIWDVKKGTVLHTFSEGQEGEDVMGPFLAMVSPAGNKVVTGPLDGPQHIWDVETGKHLHTFPPGRQGNFSPAGDKVVTHKGAVAMIWDVETGKLLHSLKGHEEHVWLVEFNPAGDKVVIVPISVGAPVKIWDVKTGELLHSLKHDGKVWSAVFNPAGDKVAVGFENEAKVWDLEQLRSIPEFLAEKITLQQVAILNDIFEVKIARDYVRKVLKEKAFEETPLLSTEGITFNFNQYPHLYEDYNALPEAIRRLFDPYVTKLSSSAEEQAPIGS